MGIRHETGRMHLGAAGGVEARAAGHMQHIDEIFKDEGLPGGVIRGYAALHLV